MALAPDGPQTGWSIVSQLETVAAGPNQQITTGKKVTFQTADGNIGSVFIPDAMYKPDNVRAQIMAAAANMDAIGKMTGP